MKYHVIKATRLYYGYPYAGPSSDNENAEASTIEEAREWVAKLQERNPVGWNIWDSETEELVEGYDFHSEGDT